MTAAQKNQQKDLHKRLEKLLQRPENRECFDCRDKGPRWGSTNLGIFICMRCAGIHRALGVHISKIKSTTMDNWDPKMVDFITNLGNERAKAIYEAKMTSSTERPTPNWPDRKLEQHIRQKYENKQWWSDPSLDYEAIEAMALSMGDVEACSQPVPAPNPAPSKPIATSPPPAAEQPRVPPKLAAPTPLVAKPEPKPAPAPARAEEELLLDFSEKAKVSPSPVGAVGSATPAPQSEPSLFPESTMDMGSFQAAPNKAEVKNNILSAFSAPAGGARGMGGMPPGMGPPPLPSHNMYMNPGQGQNMGYGYPQQMYGYPQQQGYYGYNPGYQGYPQQGYPQQGGYGQFGGYPPGAMGSGMGTMGGMPGMMSGMGGGMAGPGGMGRGYPPPLGCQPGMASSGVGGDKK